MLTNEQLATINLRRAIFHDVPNHRGTEEARITLATDLTPIDAERRRLLKSKLVKSLDSSKAYGMVFQQDPNSTVPGLVRDLTSVAYSEARFIEASHGMARHLAQVQNGPVSSGLLCVIDILINNRRGVILMKLEREEGAELRIKEEHGRTHFEMSVLDSLVLTGNTRLFKAAAFLRTGPGEDDFEMSACDNQHNVTDSKEMARFWRRYLGCDLEEAARVSTSKFFKTAMEFVNLQVDDPEIQTVIYESLHSEFRSASPSFSPRAFLTNHVPVTVRHQLTEYLQERNVSMANFPKDTQDIRSSLRRLTYVSEAGVRVVAPEGRSELIHVHPEEIVVSDRLSRLGRS
ncbi:MAG: nucleoid-associated protein [Terracidiphilus sp.]